MKEQVPARLHEFYVRQNGRIMTSVLGNLDRLAQEVIDYVESLPYSDTRHPEEPIWKFRIDGEVIFIAQDQGVFLMTITRTYEGLLFDFGDNLKVHFSGLDVYARIQVALLLWRIYFQEVPDINAESLKPQNSGIIGEYFGKSLD